MTRRTSITPIDHDLLDAARALMRDGHPASAVIAAHAATEVVAEFAIQHFLWIRRVPELEPGLRALGRFHLTSEGMRQVYEGLSGDQLAGTELWRRYREHAKRRNGAAHGPNTVSPEDAEDSLKACADLVAHLLRIVAQNTDRRRKPRGIHPG